MSSEEIRSAYVFLTFFVGVGVGLAIGFYIAHACHKCKPTPVPPGTGELTPEQEAEFEALKQRVKSIDPDPNNPPKGD